MAYYSYHDFKPAREILLDVLEDTEKRIFKKGSVTSAMSGYENFDFLTDGFDKSELITIAGYNNSYNDVFALNTMLNITLRKKKSILFIDLENNNTQNRIYKTIALSHINTIVKSNNITMQCIIDYIKDFYSKNQNGVIFINGFQNIKKRSQYDFNGEIEQYGKKFKNLAMQLKLPIILILTLPHRRGYIHKAPTLSTFGVYDVLACVSDKIITSYAYVKDTKIEQDLYINVEKNKSGKTGLLKYGLYPKTLEICDSEPTDIQNVDIAY